MPDPATKRCTKCGHSKPLSEFYRASRSRDGRTSDCRTCIKVRAARWYQENHDRALEYKRQKYAVEREADLVRRHFRRQANLEEERETFRAYRGRLLAIVLAHYGTACACCGTAERLSIDHIAGDGADHREELFGRRNGGGVTFWRWLIKQGLPPGYQTLCVRCNQSKGRGERCRLDHAMSAPQ